MNVNELSFMEERLKAGRLDTPIQLLERISAKYGVNIYVKRDDLTGSGLTGNKIRKLEYLLYDAKRKGADTVITGGAPQSNHCRATAVMCRMVGLKPVLALAGETPETTEGNLFLDKMAGAELHFIQSGDFWEESPQIMKDIADKLSSEGKKPYIIPIGGSDAIGYRGYLGAGFEIMEQERDLGIHFDQIFCAVGTAGTLGGLVLARMIGVFESKIIGISVAKNKEFFKSQIQLVIENFANDNGMNLPHSHEHFEIFDDYIGPGYGISTQEERDLIMELAREEGLFLDPVYTGKAWWGMIASIRKGIISKDEDILFMHTGGIFGLLVRHEDFEEYF